MKRFTFLLSILILLSFQSCGPLNDWRRSQTKKNAINSGESLLLEAESSKKVSIETAKANLESAKLNAQADSIRARGIANANAIIGKSLENNRAYLEWLWIDNIEKNQNAVYYIPTEGKIPIFAGGHKSIPTSTNN